MPLSTRKLVEVAFLALQDSGIDYRGQNVGCYMAGVAHDFYSLSGHVSCGLSRYAIMEGDTDPLRLYIQDDSEVKGSFAYGPAMVANRVSYHLDLRGPTIPIDTACSSTLHTTHLGVQALRNGECEAAVVGGCQLNHRCVHLPTRYAAVEADANCSIASPIGSSTRRVGSSPLMENANLLMPLPMGER